MTVLVRPQTKLGFCARSLLAFVLSPQDPLEQWLAELEIWLSRSPDFFTGKPVMVDLGGLRAERDVYRNLIAELASRKVRVMALEGADPECLDSELPPLVTGARPASAPALLEPEPSDPSPPPPAPRPFNLMVEGPVRSGQSVCNPDGDVTIIKSVASGAEIIAGGSIHIYGTMRGRALAGVSGAEGARIFCRRLQPELIAISGAYKTADEMDPAVLGRAVQVHLSGEQIVISVLD